MSLEEHPNIHAVGLTMDILQALATRLRRDGDDCKKIILGNKEIEKIIMDFVVHISVKTDEIVGETHKKLDKEISGGHENEGDRNVPIG